MRKRKKSVRTANPAGMPAARREDVGAKLRQTRRASRLRLRDVAAKAGCSESMLSKIENGRAAPSLNALHRIADALDLTVGQLFAAEAERNGLVSRRGQRPVVRFDPLRRGPGSTLERLIPYDRSRLLQGCIHHIAPGGGSEGSIQHEGEEVAYILRGQIQFMVGEGDYALNAGDSICYRSEQPHGFRNTGRTIASMIIINTPSSF